MQPENGICVEIYLEHIWTDENIYENFFLIFIYNVIRYKVWSITKTTILRLYLGPHYAIWGPIGLVWSGHWSLVPFFECLIGMIDIGKEIENVWTQMQRQLDGRGRCALDCQLHISNTFYFERDWESQVKVVKHGTTDLLSWYKQLNCVHSWASFYLYL